MKGREGSKIIQVSSLVDQVDGDGPDRQIYRAQEYGQFGITGEFGTALVESGGR